MSDIPTDLVREFLVRVPPEDLARFRCVCKSWKQLIDDFAFIKSNLLRQMGGNKLIIFSNKNCRGNIYSISLNSLYYDSKCENKVEPKTVTLKVMPRVRFPIPSCDGLVLEYIDNNWALSNLLTKECLKLPGYHSIIDNRMREAWTFAGLGFDLVTNDYKVAKVFSHFEYSIGTIIYSLKSGSWHRIEHYPNSTRVPSFHHHGIFVNGAIHWLTGIMQIGVQWEVEGIVALDLSTEKYREISLPPFSKQIKFGYYLSMLNDCLIFSHGYDAWILNNYGVEEIWAKLLSLQHGFDYQTRLLAYDKCKEQVLIQFKDEGFLWYHLQTKCAKKVIINGLRMSFSSQVIPTSLIRLNGSKRKETWNKPRKRLKLKLRTSDVSA